MIAPQQALALRRSLLLVFGLGGTLAAHAACAGGLTLAPSAPFAWGSLGCVAMVAGARRRPIWREWSRIGLLARLVAVELALHLALTAAPWAFGAQFHHAPAVITPATLVAHAVAALVLALALLAAQHVLSAAQGFVRTLRNALRVTGAPGRPRLPAQRHDQAAYRPPPRRAHGARGPPLSSV